MTLKKATPQAIRYACLNYHYAKSVPAVALAFSVYEGDDWCGVICYGSGANNHLCETYGLKQGQILELVRVALNGKQSKTSKAVAISMRLVKQRCPLVKLLVSYADTEQGHIGTIYQATNWIQSKESKGTTSGYLRFRGKIVHARSLMARFGANSPAKLLKYDPDVRYQPKGVKIKYLYPLHPDLEAVCKRFSHAYSKKIAVEA